MVGSPGSSIGKRDLIGREANRCHNLHKLFDGFEHEPALRKKKNKFRLSTRNASVKPAYGCGGIRTTVKTDLRSILEAAALAAATLAFPACDSDAGEETAAGSTTDAGCPGATAGCPGEATGCPGTTAGCPGAERPEEVEVVLTAIEDDSYASWEAESMPHAPVGNSPHPGEVRAFFNAELAESMGAGNTEHPVGAAAVKESWVDGEIAGWFVEVKVAEGSGPETWYWWSDLANVDALGGEGSVAGCIGCHSAGVDYVRTEYPLE